MIKFTRDYNKAYGIEKSIIFKTNLNSIFRVTTSVDSFLISKLSDNKWIYFYDKCNIVSGIKLKNEIFSKVYDIINTL